jgi:predicted Zn-dependent peptidase
MSKYRFWSSLLLLSICAFSVVAQQSLKLPPFKKLKLPNGMAVVLVEQHETPIVDFHLLVRAGSVLDPPNKEGLAEVTAHLLIRGTKKRTAEQIATEIDFVGGKLEFVSEQDFSRGHAEFLKKDVVIGLDLISDSLRNPIFPLAEVQKLLRQKIDTVKQEKDQAQLAIPHYYDSYLFNHHPYGRAQDGDEVSLTKITRLDAMRFYNAHYLPGATTLVVAGDFAPAEMERMIADKFGDWKGQSATKSIEIAAPAPTKGKRLLLVDKPDSTQTFLMFGNVGIARTNPDRIAIEVVNTVFGGRFTSMLNEELRTNTGLTYGAGSFFREQRVAGPFAISTYTENSTTVEAIDLALKLLDKLHREGLSEEQLRSAKAYLKGQYPPQIETTEQLAELLAELDYYGLDEREVNDYFVRVDAVTRADAERVIKQYFPLDDLTFVLIGKAEEIREKVKKYAPRIDERKITDPGFR